MRRVAPAIRASLAVPMFDEWRKMSSTVMVRFSAWKSWIAREPRRSGVVASNVELTVATPVSSPMAVVKILKVDPIS